MFAYENTDLAQVVVVSGNLGLGRWEIRSPRPEGQDPGALLKATTAHRTTPFFLTLTPMPPGFHNNPALWLRC